MNPHPWLQSSSHKFDCQLNTLSFPLKSLLLFSLLLVSGMEAPLFNESIIKKVDTDHRRTELPLQNTLLKETPYDNNQPHL